MTTLFYPFAALSEMPSRPFMAPADVVVTDEEVTVTMDVPGMTADDLSIELDGDTLKISGERPFPQVTTDGDRRRWERLERGTGKFQRVLRVPEGLDPDAISATVADGVLTIHLPMPEARKPRRIEIAAAA